MTFLVEYSVVLGFGAGFGSVLLAVLNEVNSVRRIVLGGLGDRVGRQHVLVFTVVLCVLCVAGFWGGSLAGGGGSGSGRGKVLWVVFVIVYGIAGGGYNALFPAVTSPISPKRFILLIGEPDCGGSVRSTSVRFRQRLYILRPRIRRHVRKSSRRCDPRGKPARELQDRDRIRRGSSGRGSILRGWSAVLRCR